jgi:hypothetical protein
VCLDIIWDRQAGKNHILQPNQKKTPRTTDLVGKGREGDHEIPPQVAVVCHRQLRDAQLAPGKEGLCHFLGDFVNGWTGACGFRYVYG